ncbi:TetR family transcriptional regulator [Bacillus sp. FJAT-27916]|uniref:TetR/AcrR family transcriptional regulator n=1 Tax=Bacillaceae TaxID=186817 RepID=UPI000670990C|nr:TetR/AcrR family transcriptional regulator [Bacillus sp. FJAT-27916]KMY42934.1 TetR family transcriptional regulator [Bacillus sp. FJAT-27916]
MKKIEVQASVKDEKLVKKRRDEMIKGAVALFIEKGYHRTTTREIARAAGFSIGTLYEYIRSKDDILYLVCDNIYEEVKERLQKALELSEGTLEGLRLGISYYFRICDEMQDEVLVMYQEAKSLNKTALPYVLNKEIEMARMFEKLIVACLENEEIELRADQTYLLAHNIIVHGQMWAFRRWAIGKNFTIEDYIDSQTDLLLKGITEGANIVR